MRLQFCGLRLIKLSVLLASGVSLLSCKTVSQDSATKDLATPGASASTLLSAEQKSQYERYLKDTIASFELMRGKTGLVKDSVWICWDRDLKKSNFKDTEQLTSPTNIGLDLILLTERTFNGNEDKTQVKATLKKLLSTLTTIAYNKTTGLFFRTYWPDTGLPFDIHLSSVDNLHLAFGLWTTAESFRGTDPVLAETAQKLFDRMDFSEFYNGTTGLVGGNLRPANEDMINGKSNRGNPQGKYIRDKFDYKYFGSEARSLYALGWALGLYKKASLNIADFDNKLLGKGISGTIAEISTLSTSAYGELQLLRTWDGGGFQALLPAVLVREELYSPILGKLHSNYAKRLLSDADRFGVPAAHSASAFGVRGLRLFHSGDKNYDEGLPIYNGAAGHIDMVATIHDDVKHKEVRRFWDIAYTPHPAFMAASFARESVLAKKYADIFKQNETISSVSTCVCNQESGATVPVFPAPDCHCQSAADLPNMPVGADGIIGEPNLCKVGSPEDAPQLTATDRLYQPGLGWMDGYYVNGPLKEKVIPVLISLDQGMIALSIFSILSPDGHHVGSKSLTANPKVEARLKRAYQAINDKMAAIP